jgi:hypothetical protein
MVARPDRATAVAELLRAVELVKRYTPRALANDATEVARRVRWVIEGLDDTRTCEWCGSSFTFEATRYARQRLPAPRKCRSCRKQR